MPWVAVILLTAFMAYGKIYDGTPSSWWVVTAPIWGAFTIYFVAYVLALPIALIANAFKWLDEISSKKK